MRTWGTLTNENINTPNRKSIPPFWPQPSSDHPAAWSAGQVGQLSLQVLALGHMLPGIFGVAANGAGLGRPELVENSWPWCVPPWQLEDWLLPEHPIPPWSRVLLPLDLAWDVCWCLSAVWTSQSLWAGVLEGLILCFSFLEDFGCFPDPDLEFWRHLHPLAAGPEVEAAWCWTGGRGLRGGSPWVFLPEPLLLFFFAILLGSFTKGPLFLTMYCRRMSRAVCTLLNPLIVSILSFTNPAAEE